MNAIQEKNLMLYSIYTIIYLNDTACNSIKELSYYIKDKDKESKKIFGALLKRANKYFDMLYGMFGENFVGGLAEFCLEMDDMCYDVMHNLETSIREVYKRNNIDDGDYLARAELMRCLIALTVYTAKRIISNALAQTPLAEQLKNYLLDDMVRIADNFCKWSYRNVDKNVNLDLGKEEQFVECLNKLSYILVDSKNFETAYTKTIGKNKYMPNGLHIRR